MAVLKLVLGNGIYQFTCHARKAAGEFYPADERAGRWRISWRANGVVLWSREKWEKVVTSADVVVMTGTPLPSG